MACPIHLVEFVAALRCCIPALPRPVIAVANSAGPDSTSLLFLLRQLFPPSALLSIHVIHHLQPASPDMAAIAAENAHALGIPHHAVSIPWGAPPFPPAPTASVERTARDARYHVLFNVVTRARVPLLALGHHADDQLETAILRLARNSSLLGAAGMRPFRRWGMGSPHSPLADFGHLGLNTFIIRPLLPFPKHRILATCHAHHLHYFDDPTNSQPHITTRNAIRLSLRHDPPFSQSVSFPPDALFSFAKLKNAFLSLQSIGSDSVGTMQQLYSALAKLAARIQLIDRKVSFHLGQAMLPSPIGTLLLSSSKLLEITDPDVRFALVLRAMRYVSFHPWGSLRADADRRRHSIHRIVRALWTSDAQPSQSTKFTAGGGVLWSPVRRNPKKSLRVGNDSSLRPDDRVAWLASRIPPFLKNPQQGAGSPNKLVIDLTDQLKVPASSDVQILYDCRFLIRINPSQMPTYVKSALAKNASIKALPFTQYYWPKVVLQHEPHPDQVLAVPLEGNPIDGTEPPSWISIRWVRLLDAA